MRTDTSRSLRYHFISTLIIHNDYRPYKIVKTEDLTEQSIYSQNQITIQRIYFSSDSYCVKMIGADCKAVGIDLPTDIQLDGYYLKNKLDQWIACFVIQQQNSEYVILHSHGNHADMGMMLDAYLDMCYNLKVTIVAYDYCGFGQSTGYPNDFSCLADIERVYNFIKSELGVRFQNIILYGQSIGTGPSTYLASKVDVRGLILHSPFMSILRIFNPKIKKTSKNDAFPNIDLIKQVFCPVFILHGTQDKLINSDHARLLADQCNNLYRLWLCEDAGHDDIESNFRIDYFLQLREFIQSLMEENDKFTDDQLRMKLKPGKSTYSNHMYQSFKSSSSRKSQPKSQMKSQESLRGSCVKKNSTPQKEGTGRNSSVEITQKNLDHQAIQQEK